MRTFAILLACCIAAPTLATDPSPPFDYQAANLSEVDDKLQAAKDDKDWIDGWGIEALEDTLEGFVVHALIHYWENLDACQRAEQGQIPGGSWKPSAYFKDALVYWKDNDALPAIDAAEPYENNLVVWIYLMEQNTDDLATFNNYATSAAATMEDYYEKAAVCAQLDVDHFDEDYHIASAALSPYEAETVIYGFSYEDPCE